MTEKELLYFEDAIGHEKNLISICEESINMLEDGEVISFLESEKERHNVLLNKLMNVLEDKDNE